MKKNENSPSDPLKKMGRKKLRHLARKHKIKNPHLKSPAALRRAIRRAEAREQGVEIKQKPSSKTQAELADERRQAELKAYQEHRFRYLYAPSRFAHTGTHEEYLLEKDEELNLPDFYTENEIKILPVDPWQYYLYWDFDTATLEKVKQYLAWEETFVLRSYDVTSIAFDGSNAHSSWDAICHPLIREWYINSPVHDRHVCVELGVMLEDGFVPLLRSNTVYIAPAGVSPIRRDLFAKFIPQPSAPAVIAVPPVRPQIAARPMAPQMAEAFFQPFTPTPVLLHPRPEPKRMLDFATAPRFIPENLMPPSEPARPVPAPVQPVQAPVTWPVSEPSTPAAEPVLVPETVWQSREARWSEAEDAEAARAAGRESIRQSLGVPEGTEIRWFSELPAELSPIIFEQWITDPYDQAMFVSYSIWPWEMTEYLPLGASDWTLRKFLGASLFSWFTPGGSERMLRWQQFPGASEGSRWLRPVGASERSWSGSLQPPAAREGSAWHAWPQRPLNYSGRGLFA
ncbi:hypothetical protein COW36_18690 [bacterium (Candidatus Blackallbacteria) CG17_big_fil_post_rev_8_21_14_2_50_48_46]|uniref:DUF4912 domain-containing protein n=1 Tax=bacterium (Candidatus Blackallbacteria) CG17_big_fil_post_rev_8_21_14_2_50_48_46 TaxID=2014261 RepID=A0A2M7G153_9BACT|nr:MAG: hypothetical protein COW64_00045 [bacterium (Candidatus Blackallbacteria) CG18_big_fil_WC_8_21_14_2_50_49_26]PIW15441.1 MAG: hypothetical protein COW36_18690 [bacterium (Candidatus Blackallbacteria) CG17_big_fil_post_rev_8_21_14_2_50_48_46]PIW49698.1 MAG: hypothetical protein COW20_04675 [bacterium (Candidatus Blackallbacteria) CG13_big_fil_rev_8_21_14_2_50_49_14]